MGLFISNIIYQTDITNVNGDTTHHRVGILEVINGLEGFTVDDFVVLQVECGITANFICHELLDFGNTGGLQHRGFPKYAVDVGRKVTLLG